MIKARSWVSLDLALTNSRETDLAVRSAYGANGGENQKVCMNATLNSNELLNNIFHLSGSSLDWGRDIQLEVSTQEDTSHWRLASSKVPH
jgi:hypothetical protein